MLLIMDGHPTLVDCPACSEPMPKNCRICPHCGEHIKAELDAAIKRGQVLASLDQTGEFAEIDWQSVVNRIAELKDEHNELKAASVELDHEPGESASTGLGDRRRDLRAARRWDKAVDLHVTRIRREP